MTAGALPQELIRRKRDGGELDAPTRSTWLVRGITDGWLSRRAGRGVRDGGRSCTA